MTLQGHGFATEKELFRISGSSIPTVLGLGRVKTKSDRRAQNSGCGYTAWSFYTARVGKSVLRSSKAIVSR